MKLNRTIRKCSLYFRQVCPLKWESLTPTNDPNVRACSACNEPVYFCTTDAETMAHARRGECIAREEPDASELLRVMVLGRPKEPLPLPTESQQRAGELSRRESGIREAIASPISEADPLCAQCKYPVAPWWKRCPVCGVETGRASG